jgi:hypothetical protein
MLCWVISNFFQMSPASSARFGKVPTLVSVTKSFMACVLSSPATPITCAWPWNRAATLAVSGPWALQVGHHGAQNHSTTGLPASVAASNGLPSTVVPVNRRDLGTAAVPAPACADAEEPEPVGPVFSASPLEEAVFSVPQPARVRAVAASRPGRIRRARMAGRLLWSGSAEL